MKPKMRPIRKRATNRLARTKRKGPIENGAKVFPSEHPERLN